MIERSSGATVRLGLGRTPLIAKMKKLGISLPGCSSNSYLPTVEDPACPG